MKSIAVLGVILAMGLTGCTSTPSATTAGDTGARRDYVAKVEKQLTQWSDKTAGLSSDQAARVRLEIADARDDLESLRRASEESWLRFRVRVDTRMDQIQKDFAAARAAE